MKQRVIQAIKERRLLRIEYEKRGHLTIAPQVLGETMTGYVALFCWHSEQAVEDAARWHLLDVERIRSIEILQQHFGPTPSHRGLPSSEFKTFEAVV